MGCYDSFLKRNEAGEVIEDAQVKALGCNMETFDVGNEVPVLENGFPKNCTFACWGGTSFKFMGKNLLMRKQPMGVFVIIENGLFKEITEDDTKLVYPVFDKYGELLAMADGFIVKN